MKAARDTQKEREGDGEEEGREKDGEGERENIHSREVIGTV